MMGDCYCAAVVEALSRKVKIFMHDQDEQHMIIVTMIIHDDENEKVISYFRSWMRWTN